jgi:hypothetical protein
VSGEAGSSGNKAAADFLAMLENFLECGCIAQESDETGLYLKKMHSLAYISREEGPVPGFKATKDRLAL